MKCRYRQMESSICNSTPCDGHCRQEVICSRDIRGSPGSIPCMVGREAIEDRCYLGKDCPGAGCPYAMTTERSPPGTMYIAVPSIRHHIQMPRTIVYRKGSPPLFGGNYRQDSYTPRKRMVNACTQTTSDLLQDLIIIKKEPKDDRTCKCGDLYDSSVIVFRDGKTSTV